MTAARTAGSAAVCKAVVEYSKIVTAQHLSDRTDETLALVFEILLLITYGAKLLNADWLRQRAFFLNHEGTFGNQEGMIT